jgi:hypothetical protein
MGSAEIAVRQKRPPFSIEQHGQVASLPPQLRMMRDRSAPYGTQQTTSRNYVTVDQFLSGLASRSAAPVIWIDLTQHHWVNFGELR